jgi:hypothetical protein
MVLFLSPAAEFELFPLEFLTVSYLPCLSDRRLAAEKQAEKVCRTVSHLKDALSSKEAELHKQHEELVRLRKVGDARERVESVEGKRLRALADSLVCKFSSSIGLVASTVLPW